jgi:hypothetical protein
MCVYVYTHALSHTRIQTNAHIYAHPHCMYVFIYFISLSIDPIHGQRPHGCRNCQDYNYKKKIHRIKYNTKK